MQALIQGTGVALPDPVSNPSLPGDKFQAIKISIQNALHEILETLDCTKQAIDKAHQQQIVTFVQIIKALNQLLVAQ